MVEVKERTKVMTGTVVKIGVDDAGMLRVTTGNTPWIDDDEDEDEENYDVLPTYHPTAIDYDGKRYILREPLQCTVKWDDDGGNYLWVEYPPFDLYNTGRTVEEAIQRFNEWFADTYEWLNDVHDDPQKHGAKGLGSRLEEVRQGMNDMVTTVINIT